MMCCPFGFKHQRKSGKKGAQARVFESASREARRGMDCDEFLEDEKNIYSFHKFIILKDF